MIYGDILRSYWEKWVRNRYPAVDSENSNCVRLRGHISWALVVYRQYKASRRFATTVGLLCRSWPRTLCEPLIELHSRCYDIIRSCRRHLAVLRSGRLPLSLPRSNLMGNSCRDHTNRGQRAYYINRLDDTNYVWVRNCTVSPHFL